MKRKGIKIKRNHKNLYGKRKSKGRKVAEVILLIIIVGGLIFLGYSVAPTVINFFKTQAEESQTESEPAWTPPVSSEPQTTPPQTSGTPASDPSESSVPEEQAQLVLYAPDGTLKSADTLKKYLDSVKGKCSEVIFTLKAPSGELLYKSSVKTISDISEINTGTLTLTQIADACKAANIRPCAAISTLMDNLAPRWLDNVGYHATAGWMWLDNYADRGGKPWADPMSEEARDYLSAVAAEAAKAGFESVILQNTIYPPFRAYDYGLLPSRVQANDRSDYLAQTASECAAAAKGSQTYIEIEADELIAAAATDYDASAEIWQSAAKAENCEIIIKIDSELFGSEITLSSGKTLKVQKAADKAITQLAGEIKKITGSTPISLRISGITEKDTAAVAAAESAGCDAVIVG